jgi:hypothetical protein
MGEREDVEATIAKAADLVEATGIEALRDFAVSFWDPHAPGMKPGGVAGGVDEADEGDMRAFVLEVVAEGIRAGIVTAAMLPTLFDPQASAARFRTSEMADGETSTLVQMLATNGEHSSLCLWLRAAKVGDTWLDVVNVQRVA